MKKSQIFIGSAALVLAVGSFLATKANHKFATFSVTFKGTGLTGNLSANTLNYTTVGAVGYKTVFLKTTSTKLATLVTATSQLHRVYYK